VGTGNIAGVAIALTVGGPGAIFWMWVVAAVGMATAVVEATLAQLFKSARATVLSGVVPRFTSSAACTPG
jgi:Na+/alanine symporter